MSVQPATRSAVTRAGVWPLTAVCLERSWRSVVAHAMVGWRRGLGVRVQRRGCCLAAAWALACAAAGASPRTATARTKLGSPCAALAMLPRTLPAAPPAAPADLLADEAPTAPANPAAAPALGQQLLCGHKPHQVGQLGAFSGTPNALINRRGRFFGE